MAEAVRLVIWDLDETFWKGTLTEGGIQEYVREHHDIVIELARRGIISSICSKNDEAAILPILCDNGILDYFVFPSISWEPKGHRLAALIETAQLRPATVMFIDDNPNNRAEAAAVVPGMQVEDETFITRMLDDPRFKGKNDSALTRLAQYKLLETRKRDEGAAGGDSAAFLRGCNIRVCIEYDVHAHIDRAVELVNRTNQLNFTKSRLPEDPEQARAELLKQIETRAPLVGLVRVVDQYGDYGFVGFFLAEGGRRTHVTGTAHRKLKHFCFSCRTLGMFVEQWLYEHLGRPELNVVGEVLTDLTVPREIDWIRLVPTLEDDVAQHEAVAPEIRLYGGCEANSVGVYLGPYTGKVDVRGNYTAADGMFVRINSAAVALSTFDRTPDAFGAEAATFGLPIEYAAGDYLDAPDGTAFVFNFGMDAMTAFRYRHRVHGWELSIHPLGRSPDFLSLDEAKVDEQLNNEFYIKTGQGAAMRAAARHIRANYEPVSWRSRDEAMAATRAFIERVPHGSKLILLLDHDRIRGMDNVVRPADAVADYNARITDLARAYPYVGLVPFSECIESDEQVQIGGNHYDRIVYLRAAERIVAQLRSMSARVERELAAD